MAGTSLSKKVGFPSSLRDACLYLVKIGAFINLLYKGSDSQDRAVRARRSVLLDGPVSIYTSTALHPYAQAYTIKNYDTFKAYAASISAGSVSVSGSVITVTAPQTPGKIYLTVNGEDSVINVVPPIVVAPTITYPTSGLINVSNSATFTLSSFSVSAGEDTGNETDLQVATDSDFVNIVTNIVSAGAITSIPTNNLPEYTTLYARARYKGTSYGYSQWSATVSFKTGINSFAGNNTAVLTPSYTVKPSNFGLTPPAFNSDATRLFVGASGDSDVGTGYGSVAFIKRAVGSETWTLGYKITPGGTPTANENFGYSVDTNEAGSILVVGAPNAGNGLVYIYTVDDTSATFQYMCAQPTGNGAQAALFGADVALSIDGALLIAAAREKTLTLTNQGVLYQYTIGQNGLYTYDSTVISPSPATSERFGSAIAMSADGLTLVVGASGCNTQAGCVYVFTRTGLSTSVWTYQATLTASDAASNDLAGSFGTVDISKDGNTVAFGIPTKSSSLGAVYVFTRTGSSWSQTAKLTGSVANGQMGSSVSINPDGKALLVGASYDNTGGSNAGSAIAYSLSGGAWSQLTKTNGSASDRLGTAVAFAKSTNRAVAGGYGFNAFAGKAWFFK